ncbi:hypothetical protein P7K49_037717, partial [Saguinus oedipus]
ASQDPEGDCSLISVGTFGWTFLALPEVRGSGSCSLRLGTSSSLVDPGFQISHLNTTRASLSQREL